MAVRFVGKKRLYTGNNSIGANQSELTISFFYKPEVIPNTGSIAGTWLFARDVYGGPFATMNNRASDRNPVVFALPMIGGARSDGYYEFVVGVTYHVAIVHTQGSQLLYINGNPIAMGKLAGQTYFGSMRKWILGGAEGTPPANLSFLLGNFAVWNGYAATRDEIYSLRDQKKTPMEIGASASQRFWWTLSGDDGGTPVASKGGMLNQFGGGYDLSGVDGTGTVTYAPDLNWSPSVKIDRAYVATSGTTVGMWFRGISNGIEAVAKTLNAMPRISRNGVDLGELRDPWINGSTKCILFSLPGAESVGNEDTATISMPAGWLTTDIGLVEGSDNRTLENRFNRSITDTETLEKTLRFGVNMSHNDTHVSNFQFAKDMSKKSELYFNAQRDATGYPLKLDGYWSMGGLTFCNYDNGMDATGYPGPLGLHLHRWDDLDPSQKLDFDFSEQSGYQTHDENVTIVERTDLKNDGTPVDEKIVGKARVLDFQATPGAKSSQRLVRKRITCPGLHPKYENHVILGPYDFTYTDGVPVVVDMPDPYAPTNLMKMRLEGVGSLRWIEPVAESGGSTQMSERKHLFNKTDYSWGMGRSTFEKKVGIKQARPYDAANCPFIYHNSIGDKYPVTLAEPIAKDTSNQIKFVYSKQNPVFANLRIFAGGEVMRVDSVSGVLDDGQIVTATVDRAIESSPRVDEWSGEVLCGFRFPLLDAASLAVPPSFIVEFVADSPHEVWTGLSVNWQGSGWPTFTYDNGMTLHNGQWGSFAWVTGPDRFLCVGYQSTTSSVTNLSKTYDVDPPTCYSHFNVPQGGSFTPYEVVAHMTGQFPDADLVLEIGLCASDDLMIEIFRRVRDAYPPGKRIHLERANEIWNWGFAQFFYYRALASMLYGKGTDPYRAYLAESLRMWEIAERVFDEDGRNRSGEIVRMINVNSRPGVSLTTILDMAANWSPPMRIDEVSVAPYINCPEDASDKATTMIQNIYTAEQCIDLYIHLMIGNVGPNSYPLSFADTNARIKAYSDKTGFPCHLGGYEGDVECPLYRGVDHFQEKVRDMMTHPNWYFAEHEFFAMIQRANFKMLNIYRYSDIYYQGQLFWAMYTWIYQFPGRGDGSDGKLDNRLCRAMPGLPHTKLPTDSQMENTVSVRGQALIDWNRQVKSPKTLAFSKS